MSDALRQLQQTEKRYRDLYKRTPAMLHSIDRQGCILTVSDRWLETLGYTRDEVVNRPLVSFLSPHSRKLAEQTYLPEFFRTGRINDVPYQILTKDGRMLDVILSAVAERNENNEIVRSLAVLVDVTENKKAEQKIHQLAFYDTLTGLPNRSLFQQRLNRALVRAKRHDATIDVLFIDLDQFKGVNDTLGHGIGDELLQVIAKRLEKCLRAGDTLARLGGDEFVIFLTGVEDRQDSSLFAMRMLEEIARPVRLRDKELFTTASVGISVYPADGADADTLQRNADIAMYEAKARGRNTYQYFSSELNIQTTRRIEMEAGLRIEMEAGLRQALVQNQLFLAYQPQLDLQSGKIIGIEALVRWRHPQMGLMQPQDFIPIAEETGLIIPIGEFVLRTACAQAKAWQDQGLPTIRMAVNVSARQFKQHDFVDLVEEVLQQTGLMPHYLELELTESMVMEKVQDSIMTLTDLKIRGIHLAIDDFGTGHSSLVYLKHFPIDRLKIAQEFVRDIPTDPDNEAIVAAIIAMAQTLKLAVIAEGVEHREQLDFLHQRHCNEMQGYYFAKPLAPDEVANILLQRSTATAACLFHGDH